MTNQSVRHLQRSILIIIVSALLTSTLHPQTATVPHLVRFNGSVHPTNSITTSYVTNLTFTLFDEETGGNALWSERQNVEVDKEGQYEVLLGASSTNGLPAELFSTNRARWLGVKTENGEELPRRMLTSAPYAMKALEASTLGGYPASSFMLRTPAGNSLSATSVSGITTKSSVIINPGSANYLAKFLDPETIATSSVAENSTGIALGVPSATQKLDVLGRIKLRARGSATAGLWLTDPNGAEQLFFGQIGLDSASPLGIWHGGAWRFAMTNAGNIGIGVGTAPTAKLDLGGRAVFRSSTEGTSGFWLTSADGVRTLFVGQKGITSADSFGIWHGGAWRFIVDKSGNVGIGIDPQFRFDVLGRMRLRASGTQPAGAWLSGETDSPQLFLGQTDTLASAPFGIMHGGNWRFILRSDGKIGVGTATPTELFEVAGNLKLSSGGKLFFPDGTSMSTASTGSVSNITSSDPAIVITNSGTAAQLSLANAGITSAKLADAAVTASKISSPLPASVISGVAATLGSNLFAGSQTVQGSVIVNDRLQVQNQTVLGETAVGTVHPSEYALVARNLATTNAAVAIRAETLSPQGTALSAAALADTGNTTALNARISSPSGQAVYAESTYDTGLSLAIQAISRSTQGTAIRGEATGLTGPTFGVVGVTNAENGSAGVYAQSTATSTISASYAMYARNQASTGTAVYAYEQSTTGSTYGLYGRVESPSGVAGMFMNAASSGTIISANNASRRVFRVDTSGNVSALGTFTPNGADFAESVAVRGTRMDYQPGDVLVIDPANDRQFTLSNEPYSTHVAGIYSTKPGVLGSKNAFDANERELPLAMVGIVPCHVTAENGPIHRGDILTTSSRRGYAMKATDRSLMPGAVVGKALQNLETDSGTIEVLVTLQ